ncbi:MAG: GatB/YqeY domain-containing protein [Tannerellaceae bacterium]|nr:GatB/YqeY domain-containing protein [Tannerellaceae bacterium]
MSLFDQISEDIKNAMRAQDKVRLQALRGVKKEFLEAKTAKGGDGELSDDTAVKIIQKMVKQRKESAEIYKNQGRPELAENELAEVAAIEVYLPKQMSAEELETELKKIIAEVGAEGPKDMGKVMGAANKALAGKAEGRVISETVKKLLNS